MRSHWLILTVFLSALLSSGYAESFSKKEYSYTSSDGVEREIDVFTPNEGSIGTLRPLILFFHGGAWVKGEKEVLQPQCEYFVKRGLVTATVNYRLATPQERSQLRQGFAYKHICIEDAQKAILWVKANAKNLGVDSNKVILGGNSAGGHIALLSSQGLESDHAGNDTSAAAYILYNPAFSPSSDTHESVSSVKNLKSLLPPMITFMGTDDNWIRGWRKLLPKIQKVGCEDLRYFTAPDEGHGFFKKAPWFEQVNGETDRFLYENGFLEKPVDYEETDLVLSNNSSSRQ